jgi:DnaJ-class molecular chaperone
MKCSTCDGTGAIDAPYSGSDPSCPDCDGTGSEPCLAHDNDPCDVCYPPDGGHPARGVR